MQGTVVTRTLSPLSSRRAALARLGKMAGGAWLAGASLPFGGNASASRYHPILAVESYIWIQRFQARHQSLAEGVAEMCRGFRYAGFEQVELDADFLTADLRAAMLDEFKKNKLQLLSVYAGSTMHTSGEAEQSIADIVTLAQALASTGFQAIVTDPSPRSDHQPKSTAELSLQARSLNRLGEQLRKLGIRLMMHHHTPELADHAREWRYELAHTDPDLVLCVVDVDWAFRGGQKPLAFIEACGKRLASLHLRNDRNGVWMEDFGPGEIDYQPIAQYLHQINYQGYIVVELAYEKATMVTRPLVVDLRLSRLYAEKVFGV